MSAAAVTTIHPTAIVDDGAVLGADCRVWHFVHISAGARIGGVAVNKIEHWEFADAHAMDAGIAEASYQTNSVYGHGHPMYYDNVINTLRGDAQPETDGREGLKSLELLIAMYLSARDGKRVNLPLAY